MNKTYNQIQIQHYSAQTIQQDVYFMLFHSIKVDYTLLFMVNKKKKNEEEKVFIYKFIFITFTQVIGAIFSYLIILVQFTVGHNRN